MPLLQVYAYAYCIIYLYKYTFFILHTVSVLSVCHNIIHCRSNCYNPMWIHDIIFIVLFLLHYLSTILTHCKMLFQSLCDDTSASYLSYNMYTVQRTLYTQRSFTSIARLRTWLVRRALRIYKNACEKKNCLRQHCEQMPSVFLYSYVREYLCISALETITYRSRPSLETRSMVLFTDTLHEYTYCWITLGPYVYIYIINYIYHKTTWPKDKKILTRLFRSLWYSIE